MQLMRVRPGRMPVSTLQRGAETAGFNVAEQEVESELEYLNDKGFVSFEQNELGGGYRWRMTSEGVNFCERNGLG